jgi:hypothetical protein
MSWIVHVLDRPHGMSLFGHLVHNGLVHEHADGLLDKCVGDAAAAQPFAEEQDEAVDREEERGRKRLGEEGAQ